MRRVLIRSAVVAAVIALVAPALWFIATGDTYRTPVVSKTTFEGMSPAQLEEWRQKNYVRVSLWEHAKGTPQYIATDWVGYLEASAVVFVVIFGLNAAFMLARGGNEP
jgi:hypothetical protein